MAGGHQGGGDGQRDSRGGTGEMGQLNPLGWGYWLEGTIPCPRWGRSSPGNEAVGSCHHPLGPHQEAPADVQPIHLDGGDEGPGMGCYCLSPDDLAPLGAWWVQMIVGLPCGTGKSGVPMSHPRNLPWYPSSLIPAVARAGSRMEPPRLRMKSPAVTMVAQSGSLPPPLGLLGVGVLKSLRGLSLGWGRVFPSCFLLSGCCCFVQFRG